MGLPNILKAIRGFLVCTLLFCSYSVADSDPISIVIEARDLAQQGKYEDALSLANSAAESMVLKYGDDHIYRAYLLDDLSRYSSALGDSKPAITYSNDALKIIDQKSEVSVSDRLDFLHNLGSAYSTDGQIQKSISVFETVYDGRLVEKNISSQLSVLLIISELFLDDRQLENALNKATVAQELALLNYGPISAEYVDATIAVAKSYFFLDDHEFSSLALESLLSSSNIKLATSSRTDIKLMQARIEMQKSNLSVALRLLDDAEKLIQPSKAGASGNTGAISYNRAVIAMLQGDALGAESHFQEALNTYLKTSHLNHPAVLRSLQGLALALNYIGDYGAAVEILKSVAKGFESRFGKNHVTLGESLTELASTLVDFGKTDEAVAVALQANRIFADSPDGTDYNRATSAAALGFALAANGDKEAAIESFKNAVSGFSKVRGENSSDLPPGYLKLAELYLGKGELNSAKSYIALARKIIVKDVSNTPLKMGVLNELEAQVANIEGDCSRVVRIVKSGVEAIVSYGSSKRGRADVSRSSIKRDRQVVEKLLQEILPCLNTPQLIDQIKNIVFTGSQLPQLQSTATAIAQLNQVQGRNNNELEELLSRRKKIAFSISRLEGEINGALSNTEGRNKYRTLKNRISKLSNELIELNEAIKVVNPEYAAFALPTPIDKEEISGQLLDDEAMLVLLHTDLSVISVLITKKGISLESTDITRTEVGVLVARLRKQLDVNSFPGGQAVPEFDIVGAHRLYESTLAKFEPKLEGIDHLIVVADGPLQRIPFSIFLTDLPDKPIQRLSDYGSLPYLAKLFSISYLPSAGSLSILRNISVSNASDRKKRFVGFGDPVVQDLAAPAKAGEGRGGILRSVYGAQINADLIQDLYVRLPESAKELMTISQMFDENQVNLYLGEDATRSQVMLGDWQNIEVLAFATHGIMANELTPMFKEPGLLMSPPKINPSGEDIFLTASDIASMSIDAELVLLSACNTAAPASEEIGAEGLSGLARSFFYAGAKALLVSHWYVESKSAQWITTETLSRYLGDSVDVRKSSALNSVMLDFIDGNYGRVRMHPAFWAPFVLVGDA